MKTKWLLACLVALAQAQVSLPNGQFIDTTSGEYVAWRTKVGPGMHYSAFGMPLVPTLATARLEPTAKKAPDSVKLKTDTTSTAVFVVIPPNVAAPASPLDSAFAALIPDSITVPSLNLRQTELRDAFSALGIQYGINILVDPTVTGSATLQLKKIKLRNALRILAQENGLTMTVTNGTLKIYRIPPPPPPTPAPPPEPICEVTQNNGLVSIDAQGASLAKLVRKLSDVTGSNIILEQGLTSNVTLLLQKLPLTKLLVTLAEAQNLTIRERSGVWNLSAPPAKTGDGSGSRDAFHIQIDDSLITLEASQAPLQQVVTSLIQKLGGNQVVLGTLNGQITVRLNKVLAPKALDLLLAGTDYTWWNRDGAWYIGPSATSGVTNSELLVLKHIKAEEALEMIPVSIQRNVQLKVMKSHNGIMTMGSREAIDGIQQFLQKIDFPVPQILIEALVVDVDMDKIRAVGANAYLGRKSAGSASRSIYPGPDLVFDKNDLTAWMADVPGLRDVVKLPEDFFLKVKAMEQEKLLQIRSRPQIATLNGSEATITVGQTQYFLLKTETNLPQGTGTTSQTTERFDKIDANVTLTVTPFVTGKGEITCDIVPDFSEPEGSFDATTPPTINHRVLKSKVRLRDGETIILGGLVKQSIQTVHEQVPFLGSIPVLGWLFKNQNTTKSRSQLLIFVTPHIYYGSESHVDPDKIMKSLEE